MNKGSTGEAKTHLVIVESPAKIKTISKFLGKNYKIMSTLGHVKDLPEKKLGVSIKDGAVDLEYTPLRGKKTLIAEICKQARSCDEILLASDPDREGEIISFHIGQEIAKIKDVSNIFRITFNEITKPAVQKAIEIKSSINQNMVSAQQARRVLDRWVGYEVSPILWRKLTKGLSAGRVQSVAVLLVCNREAEIEKFIPEESWSLTANMLREKDPLKASLYKIKNKVTVLKNESEAKEAEENLKKETFQIDKITDKERIKKPLAPFITSTLQQAAYNQLGFSVDRTMAIAQKLYEGVPIDQTGTPQALITYMRTDSLRLSETALTDIRAYVDQNLGKKYLPSQVISYAKSKAQDAHEAVRPISIHTTPKSVSDYLESNMAKLYDLIWKRAVASQMTPAKYAQKQILIQGGDYTLKANGSSLTFDGFLKVYKPEEDGDDKELLLPDNLSEGNKLDLQSLQPKQHFTQPPPRYNEASLVKEMEKQGIGRPSTYSATLSTIQKRKYVDKIDKRFTPTVLGRAVTEMLTENLSDIINISFTAKMEEGLDEIASGKKDRDELLLSFYKKFKKDLDSFEKNVKGASKKVTQTEIACPACKENKLVIRLGKAGEFLGCPGFPECKHTSAFEKTEDGQITPIAQEKPKELDIDCPKCGSKLIERKGRYGPFATCPGFPGCKYIHKAKK